MIQRTAAANRFIKTISKEIREASNGVGVGSLWVTAGENSLTFYSDVNGDGLAEKISYTLAEGETDLKRTVVEPGSSPYYATEGETSIVCAEVQNGTTPIFTYYDENYVGIGDPLTPPINFVQVRLVGVSLNLNSLNKQSSYPLHVETKIHLRNL